MSKVTPRFATTGFRPDPPATPQERRTMLFTAGIWLVFLTWTIIGFVTSTAPVGVQVMGWLALAVFPIVYLEGFLHPEPISSLSRPANTLLYTIVIILLGLVMSQSASIAIINVVSYLMALWVFNRRLFVGITAVVLLTARWWYWDHTLTTTFGSSPRYSHRRSS